MASEQITREVNIVLKTTVENASVEAPDFSAAEDATQAFQDTTRDVLTNAVSVLDTVADQSVTKFSQTFDAFEARSEEFQSVHDQVMRERFLSVSNAAQDLEQNMNRTLGRIVDAVQVGTDENEIAALLTVATEETKSLNSEYRDLVRTFGADIEQSELLRLTEGLKEVETGLELANDSLESFRRTGSTGPFTGLAESASEAAAALAPTADEITTQFERIREQAEELLTEGLDVGPAAQSFVNPFDKLEDQVRANLSPDILKQVREFSGEMQAAFDEGIRGALSPEQAAQIEDINKRMQVAFDESVEAAQRTNDAEVFSNAIDTLPRTIAELERFADQINELPDLAEAYGGPAAPQGIDRLRGALEELRVPLQAVNRDIVPERGEFEAYLATLEKEVDQLSENQAAREEQARVVKQFGISRRQFREEFEEHIDAETGGIVGFTTQLESLLAQQSAAQRDASNETVSASDRTGTSLEEMVSSAEVSLDKLQGELAETGASADAMATDVEQSAGRATDGLEASGRRGGDSNDALTDTVNTLSDGIDRYTGLLSVLTVVAGEAAPGIRDVTENLRDQSGASDDMGQSALSLTSELSRQIPIIGEAVSAGVDLVSQVDLAARGYIEWGDVLGTFTGATQAHLQFLQEEKVRADESAESHERLSQVLDRQRDVRRDIQNSRIDDRIDAIEDPTQRLQERSSEIQRRSEGEEEDLVKDISEILGLSAERAAKVVARERQSEAGGEESFIRRIFSSSPERAQDAEAAINRFTESLREQRGLDEERNRVASETLRLAQQGTRGIEGDLKSKERDIEAEESDRARLALRFQQLGERDAEKQQEVRGLLDREGAGDLSKVERSQLDSALGISSIEGFKGFGDGKGVGFGQEQLAELNKIIEGGFEVDREELDRLTAALDEQKALEAQIKAATQKIVQGSTESMQEQFKQLSGLAAKVKELQQANRGAPVD